MSATFARFGNDLHAGRRIIPLVARRRTWYLLSVIGIVLLVGLAALRGPNLGIEFTGGSEFQVAGVADTEQSWIMEPTGGYHRYVRAKGVKKVDAQNAQNHLKTLY